MYKLQKSINIKLFDFINYGILIIISILFIYPFWDTLVLSFSTPSFARELGVRLFPAGGINLGSYEEVFQSNTIYIAYMNTLIRVILGTSLNVLVTFLGAYCISKRDMPFVKIMTVLILITLFFNGGIIPRYLLIRNLGLMGSRWALILPILTSGWSVFLARNFISSLPSALEESALIDGAHPLTVVFKIIMPISMPIIAVLALWAAVMHWNEWFRALIYTRSRSQIVLQLLLRRILIEQTETVIENETLTSITLKSTPQSVKAATIMVATIPIICFYPFLQKYFVKGVLVGAVKG